MFVFIDEDISPNELETLSILVSIEPERLTIDEDNELDRFNILVSIDCDNNVMELERELDN
jgi:hypothetical protein